MKNSFDRTLIDLRKTTPGGQTTQSSPQKRGQEIHKILADNINKDRRDGTEGAMLKKMEDKFNCEFIQAEVSISGYAIMRKTHGVNFWSGIMNAVAIREIDDLEVFVVEWQTTANSKVQIETEWWEKATNFKDPLYKCLVHRELLRAHFKRNGVDAVVGIMLVPFHQSYPGKSYPGLCVDFQGMDDKGLLNGLNVFDWSPVLDKSICVHTRDKLLRKLFKKSFYVNISTNILKDDTRLKDILNDNATVADLLQLLGLPVLEVESIKKEEKTSE